MKSLGRWSDLVIAASAVLIIPWASTAASNQVVVWFGEYDLQGIYLWNSVHHLCQLALTILATLPYRHSLCRWGFNLEHWQQSLKYTRQFLVYFGGIAVGVHVILFLLSPPPVFPFPLDAAHLTGNLGFKLILSGTCEEPLFRGFVMTVLYLSWAGTLRLGKIEMPHAGLWATALFMIAHIGFSLNPLAVHHFSITQQAQAMLLGLLYAYYFHKTRSLLAPVLVHNLFNFLLTGLGVIWVLAKR